MDYAFKAIKISENVYWVGAVDWGIRDFHGYYTSRGTTYNAFLIMADKITLIDTVKKPYTEEMFSRISSITDPSKIDYIVSNHGEMDHSGALPSVIHRIKPEKVFCSKMGIKCLEAHFHQNWDLTPVKEGEALSLGNLNLSFLATPMLHWPESIFTLLEEDKVLFSQDAFGMHLASKELFADRLDNSTLEYEAKKYFANILLPYAPRIIQLMQKTADLIEKISIIAPDHGPIWRGNNTAIIDFYARWADQKAINKGLVVYDTMWQSTECMARAMGEGLSTMGADVRILPLRATHRSDIVTELMDAGAIAIGSPTINNQMYPTVADLLCYLKGLKPKSKIGAAFGSYGWSGEAVKYINQELQAMNIELVNDGLKVQYVPNRDSLAQCYALGEQLADRLKSMV